MSDDGVETRERIMEATYDALSETGYAALTMSDIAAASDVSTSLLHYHFDTKEDLLVAFLEHLVDRLEDNIAEDAPADPIGRIHYILQWYVLDPDEDEREAFHVALLELRTQAPRNERYRNRVREADRVIRDGLSSAIEEGIETGQIRPVDPDSTAALLLTAADGAHNRLLMTGDPVYTDIVSDALTDHVLVDLFTAEASQRWQELTGEV